MAGLIQDFELGFSGLEDEVLGGHRAADLAAQQLAEEQGLNATDTEQVQQQYEASETNQHVLGQAAAQAGKDFAGVVPNAVGLASGAVNGVVNGASKLAWAFVPTWLRWTGAAVLVAVAGGVALALFTETGNKAAQRAAKVAKVAAL